MFVCPKCGFKDSPIWKACNWELYAVYCRIDELESFDKELADILRANKETEKGAYYYRLTKSGYVHRIVKEYKVYIKRGHMREKPKDPFQKKLFEKSK